MRAAVLTAFATGKLFAVLPLVITGTKDLLVAEGTPEKEAETTADIYVPLGYPFPNGGKILSILFLPFAAWFIGRPLELSQYPMLLSVGLFAFFGSPVAAIPFLLDMFRLPHDLMPLFLIAGIWCARIGDVLGSMHLGVFTLICSAWNQGLLRLSPVRLGKWAAMSAAAFAAALYVNHAAVSSTLAGQGGSRHVVQEMERMHDAAEIVVLDRSGPNPHPVRDGESAVQRIRRTGELRVGFVEDAPPFCYRNDAGRVVGLDVDLVQLLARDLGAKAVLVPVEPAAIPDGLADDRFDLAIGGITSTISNFDKFRESRSYLDLHAGFLVEDHAAKHFRTMPGFRQRAAARGLRIAYIEGGLFVRLSRPVEGVETVPVASEESFLRGEVDADALLVTAESGAVLTMIHPEYSIVIPEGVSVEVPTILPLRDDDALQRLVDAWIEIRADDGTVGALYEYWVLGKAAGEKHEPRWSVIRDVLGWVE